jgi:hypothetical protein
MSLTPLDRVQDSLGDIQGSLASVSARSSLYQHGEDRLVRVADSETTMAITAQVYNLVVCGWVSVDFDRHEVPILKKVGCILLVYIGQAIGDRRYETHASAS